jgi:hypothetical protein
MRSFKNYLLAASGVLVLPVAFVLSAPRATVEYDCKPIGPSRLIASVQSRMVGLPMSGRVGVRPMLAKSSISQASVSDQSDDLLIDASLGGENIVVERKKKRKALHDFVFISVTNVSSSSIRASDEGGAPMIDLRATITGADAVHGSLLYALARLRHGGKQGARPALHRRVAEPDLRRTRAPAGDAVGCYARPRQFRRAHAVSTKRRRARRRPRLLCARAGALTNKLLMGNVVTDGRGSARKRSAKQQKKASRACDIQRLCDK